MQVPQTPERSRQSWASATQLTLTAMSQQQFPEGMGRYHCRCCVAGLAAALAEHTAVTWLEHNAAGKVREIWTHRTGTTVK